MNEIRPLILTKLRAPFARPQLVARPRLQEQIAQGLRRPLTLITAPAGFGKTTLVGAAMDGCGIPVAWLSLDKDDNQEERFLNYLVAALQKSDDTLGSEAARLMRAAQEVPTEAVLTTLVNELEATGTDVALVLDDYQFIKSQAVHQVVMFLVEHCPRALHLVIASRSDPPLPITRLRARGQLLELRAADLRFTRAETAEFLNGVMGLGLDIESVAVLEERTEGWIAGLQMAALALQGPSTRRGTPSLPDREEVSGFIEGFSGTNRYILDYLLEEVLARQPPATQHFLLHTSILERLTAPLCDAVLGHDGEIESQGDGRLVGSTSFFAGPSAPVLQQLERANLFLVPLDDERAWYRYHHLFADLLRAQLQRALGCRGVAQLHVRAAEWHAQHGLLVEAIHHASLAGDDEQVERYIEESYQEMVSRGEMSAMRSWRGELSRELVYRRPWLCIYEAHSHAWFGELDEADRLLAVAEKQIQPAIDDPEVAAMLGHLAYVRSRVTAMRGDTRRAIGYCHDALESVPTGNRALQSDISVTLGYEYFCHGDFARADRMLKETIRSGRALGAITNSVVAYYILAKIAATQGRLYNAHDLYQKAAQLVPEADREHLGAKAVVEIGLADLYREWNDLDTALNYVQRGLAWTPYWGKVDDAALAQVVLARIHLAQGNHLDAVAAVDKAKQLIKTRGVFSEARNALELAQVSVWLAQGQLEAADRWVASTQERLSGTDRFRFENDLAHIARARVLLAQDRSQEATTLLSPLAARARSAGRMGRVIEILLLQALALKQAGAFEPALAALTECLTLASPQRYVRVFLDEGQPLQGMLAQWLTSADPGPLRDYVRRLLFQVGAEVHAAPATHGNLVERLSERELEVLHLLALGRTNRQIARQLVVAIGTVKAHTASIYRKLDVSNRTEAAARARQLGILA